MINSSCRYWLHYPYSETFHFFFRFLYDNATLFQPGQYLYHINETSVGLGNNPNRIKNCFNHYIFTMYEITTWNVNGVACTKNPTPNLQFPFSTKELFSTFSAHCFGFMAHNLLFQLTLAALISVVYSCRKQLLSGKKL